MNRFPPHWRSKIPRKYIRRFNEIIAKDAPRKIYYFVQLQVKTKLEIVKRMAASSLKQSILEGGMIFCEVNKDTIGSDQHVDNIPQNSINSELNLDETPKSNHSLVVILFLIVGVWLLFNW